MDPLDQYTDLHIYKALEKCKVHSLVYRLGGLGAILDEGGNNLSAGQRQLFCLVRAVLHNAKVTFIRKAILERAMIRSRQSIIFYIYFVHYLYPFTDRLHRRSHRECGPRDR